MKKLRYILPLLLCSVGLVGCLETPTEEEIEEEMAEIEEEVLNEEFILEELYAYKGDMQIYGEVYIPKTDDEIYPTVILTYGFGGDHTDLEDYAEMLSKNGYVAYVFDFCGGSRNSLSDGSMLEMSLLTQREDLLAVIEMIKQKDYVDTDQIFLLGASQGGAVSAITAPLIQSDIKAMVLFYPAFVIIDDIHDMYKSIDEIPETYNIMGMEVGRKYAEDVYDMDIFAEIAGYTNDVLIIHGDRDGIVPIAYSYEASDVYAYAEVMAITRAGHGFFNAFRNNAKDAVLTFLNNHLD